MKHVSVKLAFILLGAVMLLATACEVIVNGSFYDISGSVVNIKGSGTSYKSGDLTLEDASITFTNVENGDKYSTDVSSSGSYSFLDLPDGRYRVTGSKTGWTFIPQLYNATGSTSGSAPDIFAYPAEASTTITVAMAWDNINYDIDLVATYGPNNEGEIPYDDPSSSREIVDFANRNSTSQGYQLTLDRDVQESDSSNVPRVETMTIISTSSAYPNGNTTSFRADGNEELRFYANSFIPTGGLTGATTEDVAPAYVTLYVMLGSEHYGTWYAPIETLEQTIHFINIALWNDANASGQKKSTIFSAGNYGDEVFRSAY